MAHERWNGDTSQDHLTRVHFSAPMWLGEWRCIPLTQDHINNNVIEWGDPQNENVRMRFSVDYVEAALTDKHIAANMKVEAVTRLKAMSQKESSDAD
jgi:hypothetical protein